MLSDSYSDNHVVSRAVRFLSVTGRVKRKIGPHLGPTSSQRLAREQRQLPNYAVGISQLTWEVGHV